MDNRPIGVFDSGVGGLTGVRHIMDMFPEERILFFGDTGRTPYGSKSPATIRQFTLEIGRFMAENNVKMMVAECNTISSVSLDDLRQEYPRIPVLGTIEPTSRYVADVCEPEDHIGILGTTATVKSGAYPRAIRALNPNLKSLYQIACPLFVPLIEEGIIDDPIMDLMIRRYLDEFVRKYRIDTFVLACTHYPLISENLRRIYPGIRLIDSSKETAASVGAVLHDRGMRGSGGVPAENLFFASDLSENFIRMIRTLLPDADTRSIRFKSLEIQETL